MIGKGVIVYFTDYKRKFFREGEEFDNQLVRLTFGPLKMVDGWRGVVEASIEFESDEAVEHFQNEEADLIRFLSDSLQCLRDAKEKDDA